MLQLAELIISSVTAVAIAYIGLRQSQVKRDLLRTNGAVHAELRALRRELAGGRVDERRRRHGMGEDPGSAQRIV